MFLEFGVSPRFAESSRALECKEQIGVVEQNGKHCIEIKIEKTVSWMVISRGLDKYIGRKHKLKRLPVHRISFTRQSAATHKLSVHRTSITRSSQEKRDDDRLFQQRTMCQMNQY